MTQEDSVRRLAEADAHALREQAEEWAEEHYLHDSVGAFEAGWEARQPAIDSLTAERDEARFALGAADMDIRGWFDRAEAQAARAEAAEADRKRLREALEKVEVAHFDQWCALCLGGEAPALHKPDCPVGAALATPPSEGQS